MNEEFVKSIYTAIAEDNVATYKLLFSDTATDENTIDYWKRALSLYEKFDSSQQEIFFSIIENIIVDTISNVLGVMDGVCAIDDKEWSFKVNINGVSTDNSLQDDFLEYVETMEGRE